MRTIAIIGGGISGLTAAYELEKARRAGADIDWQLFEASSRLGGIIETTRIPTPEGEYILEGGPDGWVSEKPWARELAIELGLENDLIYSNDATRKTYIERNGELLPIPDRMRLMVPEDLSALDNSPLFSPSAKAAYAAEPARAAELKANALPDGQDESVATFVTRHFGEEVTETLAAPLLSGVFGGDANNLSVRAVMPQFVALEREYGSLILGLQAKTKARSGKPHQSIFTSLRRGMASLIEVMVGQLPSERIHLECPTRILEEGSPWMVLAGRPDRKFFFGTSFRNRSPRDFLFDANECVIATSLDASLNLLAAGPGPITQKFLPTHASSAILAAFTWPADLAATFTIPQGFGFLIPSTNSVISTGAKRSGETPVFRDANPSNDIPLLAATFVDQKFPYRAPAGARILRTFFGGQSAEQLANATDDQIAAAALTQLRKILGPIPAPEHTTIRRWPHSLPQYEVGHLDRIAQLEQLVAQTPGLHLLGNSLRGVGIPDLIHAARATAQQILAAL